MSYNAPQPPFVDVWEDGYGNLVATIGELRYDCPLVEGRDAACTHIVNFAREQADVVAARLLQFGEWRWCDGMVARQGAIVAGPFERNRRPNGGHGPPGVTYVSIPDLLHPGTVGWIASMLRRASPRYVCLTVFEDGEFRAFVVRSALGEDGDLLSRHPIEGIALALALIRVWNDAFDPRVEMT